MKLQLAAFFVACGLFCTAPAVHADEILSNGGFESPLGPANSILFGNWSTFVSDDMPPAGAISELDPNSGDAHLVFSLPNFNQSFSGIQQSSSNVQTGVEYTFDGFARHDGLSDVEALFRIEWLNDSDEFVGGQFDSNQTIGLSSEYTQFSQTITAPDGATQLRAVIAVVAFGDGSNTSTVLFDDISIRTPVAVPEPNSAIVIGAGMLAAVLRRRRTRCLAGRRT